MRRTTEQWQALLEGTTEGPWFANVRGFGRIENIGPISSGFSIGDGLECDEEDADLAAVAPDAVAEVVRLRRELEELRDTFIHETSEPHYEGDYGDGHHSGLNQATSFITRILEGES